MTDDWDRRLDRIDKHIAASRRDATIEDDITDALKAFAGSQYDLYPREVWIMRALNHRRTLSDELERWKVATFGTYAVILLFLIFIGG